MAAAPISVEEAICCVLQTVQPLAPVIEPLSPDLIGKVLAQTLVASSPFPPFQASIMDGYAVVAPLEPGSYPVVRKMHAGDAIDFELKAGQVCYITTGAPLPAGANAVIKIEDTSGLGNPDVDPVEIRVSSTIGQNVRAIGSDIALGEEVVKEGTILSAAELGLLATAGCTSVHVYKRPVVGVMSTGSELVEPDSISITGSQIRDSNRISLISALREDGYSVVDLGIVGDDLGLVRSAVIHAMNTCEVIITSGGVSMGAKDFIKVVLQEMGTVIFNKLDMKPGKPTTFATLQPTDTEKPPVYFFGLPGNPVSCLVTKALFVDVALRQLAGVPSVLHSETTVRFVGDQPLTLDPERPEYHRVTVTSEKGELVARSTGFQRSSRLMSMHSAHALMLLRRGPGLALPGGRFRVLLLRPLALKDSTFEEVLLHPRAGSVARDNNNKSMKSVDSPNPLSLSNASFTVIKVGILTVSDRASQGVYSDDSGPEIARILRSWTTATDPSYPLQFEFRRYEIVPDDNDLLASTLLQWTSLHEKAVFSRCDLILTTGGTGFGPRDNTPEVVLPLLHRPAPGIAQQLLATGLQHTPLAVLARPVAGTRNRSFIATLPGSVKAIRENLTALKPLLPRIMDLLLLGDCAPPPRNS